MKRLLVAGVVVLALAVLVVALKLPGPFEPADAFVEKWLVAVVGDGASDRGWSQLDESSREQFGNDAEAFRLAAEAQDWSGFRWEGIEAYHLESWLWSVYVPVDGGLSATPAFLRDQRLVGPWCVDDKAPGFHLQVVQEWPWTPRTLGPSGLTGSSERALIAGKCTTPSMPPGQFQRGSEMVWAGHQLSVWNWTTLPLFIVDQEGRRVELPPCEKIGIDDYGREFEVRAADGYVMAIGLDVPQEGVTTFVVIGSRDSYVNNAPPAEPMAPCEGTPQVQVGV
jgi:hypothetical protein